MNVALSRRRCFNHPAREASARCPSCERFFCRECVTEHDDKVICSSCLKKATEGNKRGLIHRGAITSGIRMALGIVLAWIFFRAMGGFLLGTPAEFHEGTFWNEAVLEQWEAEP